MKFRRLGKTNINVSVVGVGTWQFGGEWGINYTQKEATAIIQRAKELEINLLDTAECYGDHTSERFVGEAIKGEREDWIVASKFGHKFHSNFKRTNIFDPQGVLLQLEDSLRALQTDYLDLYQFHSGENALFFNDEIWTMLNHQVELGKVRHLGLSVSPNTNLTQVAKATDYGISTVQIVYNRLEREPEAEVLPSCQQQDLGVLARVPLASGFLSGKYKPGTQFTNPDDVRSHHDVDNVEAKLKEVAVIQASEVPAGVNMAAWALAWVLRNPAVTTVIPGCKNPAQVEANARAVELLD
jgi:aryl-alcohol dehydrogenase-like predicted oxidoreductase